MASRNLVWTGASDDDFDNALNWNDTTNNLNPAATPPTSSDFVTFNSGAGGTVDLDGGAAETFYVTGTGTWTFTGALTLSGQPSQTYLPYGFTIGSTVTFSDVTFDSALGSGDIDGPGTQAALTVEAGSTVTSLNLALGINSGETGSLLLTGANTTWHVKSDTALNQNGYISGYLGIGNSGTGSVTVTAGASLTDDTGATIGQSAGADGSVIVSDGGTWTTAGDGLTIGRSGTGSLSIEAGGTVTDNDGVTFVGENDGGSGTLTVSGTGAVFNGTAGAVIGVNAGSTGTATVSDGGTWTTAGYGLTVGGTGAGTLAVDGGVVISDGNINVGETAGGVGTLDIGTGGTVTNDGTYTFAGNVAGGVGTISVEGAGALLNGTADFIIGNSGTGVATVSDGGVVNAGTQIAVGQLDGSSGTLTIESGGIVTGTGTAVVGNTAGSNGQLSIMAGGTLMLTGAPEENDDAFVIGDNGASDIDNTPTAAARGSVVVDGAGALLDVGNPMALGGGSGGDASLTVEQGGSVSVSTENSGTLAALAIANAPNDVATVTVTGSGSQLSAAGYVLEGRGGTANLNIENGGTVLVTDSEMNGSGIGIGAGRGSPLGQVGGSGTATVISGGELDLDSSTSGITVGGNGVDGVLNVNTGGVVVAGTSLTVGTATDLDDTVYGGTGTLSIGQGGTVEIGAIAQSNSFAVAIGDANSNLDGPTTSASGTATVSGSGALLDTNGSGLGVGVLSDGNLTISQGGSVVAGSPDSSQTAALGVGRLSNGTITVEDSGSTLTVNGTAYFGKAGTGTLIVQNDGSVMVGLGTDDSGDLLIGGAGIGSGSTLYTGGSGTATVTTGGDFFSTGNIDVGNDGSTGLLTVENDGTVETGHRFLIGNDATLQAGDSAITLSGTTPITSTSVYYGSGTIDVDAGGLLKSDGPDIAGDPSVDVGAAAGSTGTLNVSGAGAEVDAGTERITVGDAGAGTMLVGDGGIADAGANYSDTEAAAILGNQSGATGSLTVTDPGSMFTADGDFIVGVDGAGTLTVENQGVVTAAAFDSATETGGSGTTTVTGADSQMNISGQLTVGDGASAGLTIAQAGTVTAGSMVVGEGSGSDGTVDVDDSGSLLQVTGNLSDGQMGTGALTVNGGTVTAGGGVGVGGSSGTTGTLDIEAGGTVTDDGANTVAGAGDGSTGTILVEGAGALLNGTAGLVIGNSGTGVATVADGGTVSVDGEISVGSGTTGVGSLTIDAGGTVAETEVAQSAAAALDIGYQGAGTVTVSGAGALLNLNGNPLQMGNGTGGSGTLTVSDGGTVEVGSADSDNGDPAGSLGLDGSATVIVTGAGSSFTAGGFVYAGRAGTANILVENDGSFTVGVDPMGFSEMGIGVGSGGGLDGLGGSGTATVTTGGVLDSVDLLKVGGYGVDGTLNVNDGNVAGDGGIVEFGTQLLVGLAMLYDGTTYGGTGDVAIGAYGTVMATGAAQDSYAAVIIGDDKTGTSGAAGTGTITVSGTGALLDSNGSQIAVGPSGTGTLLVSQGGSVVAGTPDSTTSAALSVGGLGVGSVIVTDAGSHLTANGFAFIGRAGTGTLLVENNATMTVGADPNGSGGLSIGGANLKQQAWQTLYIGGSGTATVALGGYVYSEKNLFVGSVGASGLLTISDQTTPMNTGTVEVGERILIGNDSTLAAGGTVVTTSSSQTVDVQTIYSGNGTIDVDAGGVLKSDGPNVTGEPSIDVGAAAGSTGTLNVSGAGAVVDAGGDRITVGDAGTGTMLVSDGGTAEAGANYTDTEAAAQLGDQSGSTGALTVTDPGSTFAASGAFDIGIAGSGTLTVENQGVVTAASLDGAGTSSGTGAITVTGSLSQLNVAGQFILGDQALATMSVGLGGTVTAGSLDLGETATGIGSIDLEDANTLLDVTNDLTVGVAGIGVLTVGGGSELTVGGNITVGAQGTVIGSGGTIDPGYYYNTGITYGPLTIEATVAIENTSTFVAEAGTLELNGAVTGTGVLEIDDGGTLQLDQAVASTQTVQFATSDGVLDIEDPTEFTPMIGGYVAGDVIDVNGTSQLAAPSYTYNAAGGYTTLTWTNGTSLNFVGDFSSGSIDTPYNNEAPPTCFLAGTRIATERGAIAVEALRIGDRVRTAAGGARPIVWIGRRRIDPACHPEPHTVLPVRIHRGAFGRNAPRRALHLSPDHAVFVDDVLIPVKYLINGTTVCQMPAKGAITYFHIELDRHDVVLAEGLPVESYLETGGRANFENGGAPIVLHPDFSERVWEALGCAPLVVTGPQLTTAQRVLQERESLAARSQGSTLPGFMIPRGSSAALMRRISASSAPPRQSAIM